MPVGVGDQEPGDVLHGAAELLQVPLLDLELHRRLEAVDLAGAAGKPLQQAGGCASLSGS